MRKQTSSPAPSNRSIRRRRLLPAVLVPGVLALAAVCAAQAAPDEEKVIRLLADLYPIREGYFVSGALDPWGSYPPDWAWCFDSARVVVGSPDRLYEALSRLDRLGEGYRVERFSGFNLEPSNLPPGYRGIVADVWMQGAVARVQFLTVHMNAWLLWTRALHGAGKGRERLEAGPACLTGTALYLAGRERAAGASGAALPEACRNGYGLPAGGEAGLSGASAAPPASAGEAFAIPKFAGLKGFVAGDEATRWLVSNATPDLWPERRVRALLQEILDRPGAQAGVRPLSAAGMQELAPGLLAFAVDRFGRGRIGAVRSVPAGFPYAHEPGTCPGSLFPGEAVRVAGYLHCPGKAAVVDKIVVFSDHHYGPEPQGADAAASDKAFLGVGHLLALCAREGIDTGSALLTKAASSLALEEDKR